MKKEKKPWPTKEAMEQVYEMNLWGNNNTEFYSGEGSHHPKIVTPYIDKIIFFLTSFEEPITVCDLGCGDFNIGKQLVPFTKNYIAIDIVPQLITHNQKTYKNNNLNFKCLDIAVDKIPSADCVILRQVLQHLSNSEVLSVVQKLSAFKYIILTEHIPEGNFTPNEDIISGQGIRLKKNSGINLLAPPFNLKIKEEKKVVSIKLNNNKGVINTTIYLLF